MFREKLKGESSLKKKPNIYVLSDLHFDSKSLSGAIKNKLSELRNDGEDSKLADYQRKIENNPKYQYSKAQVLANVKVVATLLSENKENNVFVLAGDFFDDLDATLDFIALLEKLKVTSFIVLGNHDYWSYSKDKQRISDSIQLATNETKDNKYCRLLVTGRKYHVGDLSFIGDSGFTNLAYIDHGSGFQSDQKTATTKELTNVTIDMQQIKDLSAGEILSLNEKWVAFAKSAIEIQPDDKPLIVVTHWPMNETAFSISDSWWKTNVDFPKNVPLMDAYKTPESEKYWLINGHTHKDKHYGNAIAAQAGYRTESWFKNLTLDQLGQLLPTEKLYGLIDVSNALTSFEDFSVIMDGDSASTEVSRKIKFQGYRRAGNVGNKTVLSAYLTDPKSYIRTVRHETYKIKNEFSGNGGYSDARGPQLYRSKLAIKAAVEVLKDGYAHNSFEFFTALIVTGYAYNGVAFLLNKMRKVSTYDIVRQAMVYLTIMKSPEIDVDNIESIKSYDGKWSAINVANVDMKIPLVNKQHLNLEAFLPLADGFNRYLLGSQIADKKRLLIEDQIVKKKKPMLKSKVSKPKHKGRVEPVRIPFEPIKRGKPRP